jgi:hypothetical protein
MEVTEKVVRKVARKENTEPGELEPLCRAVDPDALNDIFASEQQSGVVVFPYMNYEIMVASTGTVTIE